MITRFVERIVRKFLPTLIREFIVINPAKRYIIVVPTDIAAREMFDVLKAIDEKDDLHVALVVGKVSSVIEIGAEEKPQ